MGISRVQRGCEDIQHYGQLRDERNKVDLRDDEALRLIQTTLARVKQDYNTAERWLRNFYDGEEDGA